MLWSAVEKKYNTLLKSIDLFKIDIEGSDLKVLKTIDLEKINPTLVMVEASDFDEFGRESIISYLKSKKYKILYDNKLNVILTKNNS